MKQLIIPILLSFASLSCSCVKSNQAPAPTCTDASCDLDAHKGKIISEDNWELTLPVEAKEIKPNEETLKVLATIPPNGLVLFIKEPFDVSIEEYGMFAIQGLKENNAELLSISNTKINDNQFIVIEAVKEQTKLWAWTTVKNGYGYGLTCGGSDSSEQVKELCFSIANSLKIK